MTLKLDECIAINLLLATIATIEVFKKKSSYRLIKTIILANINSFSGGSLQAKLIK